jgi:hypothetical protein
MLKGECAYCGKPIIARRRKGGREREYCNESCRQLAYQVRHPEKVYAHRIISRIRPQRWKEDPRLLPWQEELDAAHTRIDQLNGQILDLESSNSLLRLDLYFRDQEVTRLRWLLAEVTGEIARLNILLESQSKRKH